jgi:hypothetical protein
MIEMKDVMDLNEYEEPKDVRVKSLLYFKAIAKVLEENDYLELPGDSENCSFLGYLETFFDFLTKDLIGFGFANMGFLIGESHPDIKAKVESLGVEVKDYLIIHQHGENMGRSAYSFKTKKTFGLYDWSLIAAVSIDLSGTYQYHSISKENRMHVFHPSLGNGSTYEKNGFKWGSDAKDLRMLAILLKKITIE